MAGERAQPTGHGAAPRERDDPGGPERQPPSAARLLPHRARLPLHPAQGTLHFLFIICQ